MPVAESADKIVVSKINMDSPLINVTGPVMPHMVPPKWVPPDHLWQIMLQWMVPPDQVRLPWMVPPDHLWRRKWSPVATDGPP